MLSLRFSNVHPCCMLLRCFNVVKRDIYSFGPTFTKRTQSYKERRLLGYSQEQMFDIAVDVSRYREFVPWCNESVVLERGQESALVRIGVGFPPLSETYMSRVTFKRPGHVKSIAQNAVMFHHLVNEWKFKPGLPDNPSTCIVEFAISTGSCVLTQKVGQLLLIGLNRPSRGNRLNRSLIQTLHNVVTSKLEGDANVFGGVLYGEGQDFCLGLDIEELIEEFSQSPTLDTLKEFSTAFLSNILTKPLIAAINGRAIGAGLELSLVCDLRVAEHDSILGLHKRKYCIPMMNMGSINLPNLIGLSRSLDLTLTGRQLHANEASEFGLVNRITQTGTALGVAVKMIDSLYRINKYGTLLTDRMNLMKTVNSSFQINNLIQNELENVLKAIHNDGLEGFRAYITDQTKLNDKSP